MKRTVLVSETGAVNQFVTHRSNTVGDKNQALSRRNCKIPTSYYRATRGKQSLYFFFWEQGAKSLKNFGGLFYPLQCIGAEKDLKPSWNVKNNSKGCQ